MCDEIFAEIEKFVQNPSIMRQNLGGRMPYFLERLGQIAQDAPKLADRERAAGLVEKLKTASTQPLTFLGSTAVSGYEPLVS